MSMQYKKGLRSFLNLGRRCPKNEGLPWVVNIVSTAICKSPLIVAGMIEL
jgi:hypothetical protein